MSLPPDKSPLNLTDLDPLFRLKALQRDIAVEFGIGIRIDVDHTLPLRGYWRITIGDGQHIQGVNTAAALALLDGVQIGAREANRINTIRAAERAQGL
jgi:hypothetical protein